MKEKAANIQRGDLNVLQEAWKRIPENCLQKLQEGLAQRHLEIKVVIVDIDNKAH